MGIWGMRKGETGCEGEDKGANSKFEKKMVVPCNTTQKTNTPEPYENISLNFWFQILH